MDHCVTMVGHLAQAYWSRYKRETREEAPVILCTCLFYIQHAECEHEYFVSCMACGLPVLSTYSDTRRRGRKRKSTEY